MVSIRDAQLEDVPAIAAVHVASWKEAYRGMLPDDYLDTLSIDDRLPWWEERFRRGLEANEIVLVAEDDEHGVQGFASTRQRDEFPQTAELAAIYLSPDSWGHGVGKHLLDAVVCRLLELGSNDVVLWVHPDNHRARRFYEAAGWTYEGLLKHDEVWGLEVPSILYRLTLPSLD
jgi:RimJ/RimL family protein N-acetyltransferase